MFTAVAQASRPLSGGAAIAYVARRAATATAYMDSIA